jgi:hypothetical protein
MNMSILPCDKSLVDTVIFLFSRLPPLPSVLTLIVMIPSPPGGICLE